MFPLPRNSVIGRSTVHAVWMRREIHSPVSPSPSSRIPPRSQGICPWLRTRMRMACRIGMSCGLSATRSTLPIMIWMETAGGWHRSIWMIRIPGRRNLSIKSHRSLRESPIGGSFTQREAWSALPRSRWNPETSASCIGCWTACAAKPRSGWRPAT